MLTKKTTIGDFSRDTFKWLGRNLETLAQKIRWDRIDRILAEENRYAMKFRGDQIGFSAKRAEIREKADRESELAYLDGVEIQLEKTLAAVRERKNLIGHGNQHDVKNNVLRFAR